MRITKSELKKIILEEYQRIPFEEGYGAGFGDGEDEEDPPRESRAGVMQILSDKDYIVSDKALLQIWKILEKDVRQKAQFGPEVWDIHGNIVNENALTNQISQWSKEGESIPKDQTVGRMEGPQEEIARIAQGVVDSGKGLQDIATALESEGLQVERSYRYITVSTAGEGNFMIASTSNVELDGGEAIVQGPGGVEYAVGSVSH